MPRKLEDLPDPNSLNDWIYTFGQGAVSPGDVQPANKALAGILAGITKGLYTLPQRFSQSAGDYWKTKEFDPSVSVEAALLPMGGTAFSAPKGAIGAGPSFSETLGYPVGKDFVELVKQWKAQGKELFPSEQKLLDIEAAREAAAKGSGQYGSPTGPAMKPQLDYEALGINPALKGKTIPEVYGPMKHDPSAGGIVNKEELDKILSGMERDKSYTLYGPEAKTPPEIAADIKAKMAGKKYGSKQEELDDLLKELKQILPEGVGSPRTAKTDIAAGGGPDPSWMSEWELRKQLIKSLPTDVPFKIPERGQALGFNVPAAHGTTYFPQHLYEKGGYGSVNLGEDFGKFRMPETEIGVHFGSPRAAGHFTAFGSERYAGSYPRVFPVALKAQNPLEMPDLGSWTAGKISRELQRQGWPKAEVEAARMKNPDMTEIENLRDYIQSKGYDSIKYINKVEDRGHTSYIALKPNQIRSVFAKFDPSKLHLPDILAGVAGGAVAAPATFEELRSRMKEMQ